jgi:glucose-1-phosphate thymidylyltransferase
MKGIVLAGGLGKRMLPLTEVDNKHLLPVGKQRMIELPIASLVEAGIDEVILITGGQRAGTFLELLKTGRKQGLKQLYYTYQEGSGGVVEALQLAEPFMRKGEECVVILGDNYFEDNLTPFIQAWDKQGAEILLFESDHPWHFGVVELDGARITSIQEKPSNPTSNMVIPGIYFFDGSVWDRAKKVRRAASGELEIPDLLKLYLQDRQLSWQKYDGFWTDMGSIESWTEVIRRRA